MNAYNSAFFGLFENVFLLFREREGEDEALNFFRQLMVKGLMKSYGDDFKKGDPNSFASVVGKRDELVGLHVEFPRATATEIIYQFHDDPFPNLCGIVAPEKLDATYMNFKVNHLLGEDWQYQTTKHLWMGDAFTEHRIFKNAP